MDYAQAFVMGVPAALIFLERMVKMSGHFDRLVDAMERIADRLENAEYVKLREAK